MNQFRQRLVSTKDLFVRGEFVRDFMLGIPSQDGVDLEGLINSINMDGLIMLA